MVKERKSPCFEVYSSQIEMISTPEDYYLALNKLILSSEFRINMSALYLGTSEKEQFLVERLANKAYQNKDIKINMLIDYNRGIRESNASTSQAMLYELLSSNSQHKFMRFGLFKNPSQLRVLGRLVPTIAQEVLGVHHIKAHVFDNDVLITGANLSSDYFTNRQDR